MFCDGHLDLLLDRGRVASRHLGPSVVASQERRDDVARSLDGEMKKKNRHILVALSRTAGFCVRGSCPSPGLGEIAWAPGSAGIWENSNSRGWASGIVFDSHMPGAWN